MPICPLLERMFSLHCLELQDWVSVRGRTHIIITILVLKPVKLGAQMAYDGQNHPPSTPLPATAPHNHEKANQQITPTELETSANIIR
jgi:hypothetical protein